MSGRGAAVARAHERLAAATRVPLATLPTPLEAGPRLPGGARLLVKRDDLTGLGMGGNKARKLEHLCAAARAAGADALVTVGAAQSNHARMTAAAGAVLGLETHLVLGSGHDGDPAGNQLLARLFGARVHRADTDDWDELAVELEGVAAELREHGRRPYAMPIGGSTPVGATGFLGAWLELMDQCAAAAVRPAAIVHASSSGGTHAGLLAGRALWAAAGLEAPDVLAVDVAKTSGDLAGDSARLARELLDRLELHDVEVPGELVELDGRWTGPAYAEPTAAGDAAIEWAALHGAWVLDRTYTGKAFAGLLGHAEQGRFGAGDTVIFWHTGGQPAVFAPHGAPPSATTIHAEEAT